MNRAVIYCRVSTQEQTENLSLATQQKACEEYCVREGYEVGHVFVEEGKSAKNLERKQIQALLEYCRKHKGQVNCVVVYNVSRLSRNTYYHQMVRYQLAHLGITLRSATETFEDDANGRFTETVLAAVAQLDNEVKADRTKHGMRAALERGRWPFQPPLGYASGSRGGPCLVPDPERHRLVRLAFAEMARGARSRREVLRRVTAEGLRTRVGGELSIQSFSSMLRNPIYAGRMRVDRWRFEGPGDFEPLVSEETFQLVQSRLKHGGREVETRQRTRPDFPLKRFVRCARCETPLTASWSKGRSKPYAYYHCRRNCREARVAMPDFHRAFIEHLERLQPRSEFVRLFNEVVRDVWRERLAGSRVARQRIEKEIRALQSRRATLEDAFIYARRIDRETYHRQKDMLGEQLTMKELELHETKLDEMDVDGLLAFAEHALTNAARLWQEAEFEQKLQLQEAFFPEGLTYGASGFGTAVTCLAFMQMPKIVGEDSRMASPAGFEPASPP